MNRRRLFKIVLVLTAAIVPLQTQAQTSNGTLVGSVVDPTGAVVQKATVTAISQQYGTPHETHTDSVGTYRLESLQPGTYTVTFTASGFKILNVTGVILNGSLTTTINGKLALAATEQSLEVRATAAQIIWSCSAKMPKATRIW